MWHGDTCTAKGGVPDQRLDLIDVVAFTDIVSMGETMVGKGGVVDGRGQTLGNSLAEDVVVHGNCHVH